MTGRFRSNLRALARLAIATALFAAPIFGAGKAAAQDDYPDGTVQMIVSYGAGGGTDRQSRITARFLEQTLGVAVAVQNVPGAGSQVATAAVLREPADGYTILATNQPDLNMTVALQGAPYSLDDFSLVAVDVYDPRLLVVPNDSPYQTFQDFLDAARADPGTLSIAVVSGGAQDVFTRWLVNTLDIDVRIVGYPSGGAAASAMLGGHVTANLGDDFSRLDMRSEVRGLLLGSAQPSPRWPEAELLTDAFERENLDLPAPDFLARYHVYMVRSDMKEEYPERFAKLQEAFIAAAQLPEYQAIVTEQAYEDLQLMAPGDEYEEAFQRSLEVLTGMKDELQ